MVEYQEEVYIKENIQPRPLTSRRRTGRVFYVDTFEQYYDAITEKWLGYGDGTSTLSTDYPKDGMSCLKLTSGAASGDDVICKINMGGSPAGRFGIEFELLCMEDVTNVKYILLYGWLYLPTEYFQFLAKYLGGTNTKWQYQDSDGVNQDVPDGDYIICEDSYPFWNNIKLIVDLVNGKYVTLYCNEQTFDLSTYSMYNRTGLSGQRSRLELYFAMENNDVAQAVSCYIDNLILTDLEP